MTNFFITGTDTDVGKTFVTALLAKFFKKQGKQVIPYKPVQSGALEVDGKIVAPDVQIYQHAIPTMNEADAHTYLLKKASSPHLAAEAEGTHLSLEKILQHYRVLEQKYDTVLVEGAGGLIVPLNKNGDSILQLMKELALPVILVARSGVGTINHTVLSVMAMKETGLQVGGIILNRLKKEDPLIEEDNKQMIEIWTGIPVLGVLPFIENVEEFFSDEEGVAEVLASLQIEKIKEIEHNELTINT